MISKALCLLGQLVVILALLIGIGTIAYQIDERGLSFNAVWWLLFVALGIAAYAYGTSSRSRGLDTVAGPYGRLRVGEVEFLGVVLCAAGVLYGLTTRLTILILALGTVTEVVRRAHRST